MKTDRPLRVLIYGINFAPELTGIGKYTGAMAAWLADRGHEVRVITAPPHYPDWRIGERYRHRAYVRERWHGVDVRRAPVWVPRRPTGAKRLLHYLTFALSSVPLLLSQITWRPDIVWMAAPSLGSAPGALLLARLTGAVSCLHVQDFEVDAAFGLGLLRGGRMRRIALGVERMLLRSFDVVSSISSSMTGRLLRKGVAPARVAHLPNWADQDVLRADNAGIAMRAELGIPADAVVAMYAGSLGRKQGFETLLEAARHLRDHPALQFVFCGQAEEIDRMRRAWPDLERVTWLPLQPVERLPDLMQAADLHLLPQRQGMSELVLPSKLTNMLASGRPVVCTAEPGSDLANWVEGCGRVVPPEDTLAVAAAITELAGSTRLRDEMGRVARRRAEERLSKSRILGDFFEALELRIEARRADQRGVALDRAPGIEPQGPGMR